MTRPDCPKAFPETTLQDFLERNHQIVATWPAWKRDTTIYGTHKPWEPKVTSMDTKTLEQVKSEYEALEAESNKAYLATRKAQGEYQRLCYADLLHRFPSLTLHCEDGPDLDENGDSIPQYFLANVKDIPEDDTPYLRLWQDTYGPRNGPDSDSRWEVFITHTGVVGLGDTPEEALQDILKESEKRMETIARQARNIRAQYELVFRTLVESGFEVSTAPTKGAKEE